MHEEEIYAWPANGELWLLDNKGDKVKQLGVATKKPEAVMLIIKDKFKEPCASFKVRM